MSRRPNRVETVLIKVSTTPQIEKHLERLVATGLYGKNTAEAVERMVARRIEDLIQEGFFERAKDVRQP